MKSMKIIAPIAVAAAGAAAYLVLSKKTEGGAAKNSGKEAKAAIKNAKTGSYSFLSGYKDPATVEVTVEYDADKFEYCIIEEQFLSYSSDSHVAVILGEDFNMQLEYANYYSGEDFAAYSNVVKEKYKGYGEVSYGANKGFKYTDGDNLCFCLPIEGDDCSYILINVMKAKDSKIKFEDLPQIPDIVALMSSIKTTSKK